ncbi:MAG: hypothetical protein M1814_006003 [Vezdaea aestivalis]|nr:MAG: hypothetical protein M1814_006003 [Vezdaea aestivalis]
MRPPPLRGLIPPRIKSQLRPQNQTLLSLRLHPFSASPLRHTSISLLRPHRPLLPSLHIRPITSGPPLSQSQSGYYWYQIKLGLRWTLFVYLTAGAVYIGSYIYKANSLAHQYPTPDEWSFRMRIAYHNAVMLSTEPVDAPDTITWPSAAQQWKVTMQLLEDPKYEGTGLRASGEEDQEARTFIAGVGEAGLDISARSSDWRRGYFSALLNYARAAEHVENIVADTSRNIFFEDYYVIGPSNPTPRQVPPTHPPAPREENCTKAFPSPHALYSKLLTTTGLTTAQRVTAALSYADWLLFKNLPSSAEELYTWALDIALSAYPPDLHTQYLSPMKTLPSSPPSPPSPPSSALLTALTAFATQKASSDPSQALAIFTSILRARRTLPLPLPSPNLPVPTVPSFTAQIMSALTPPPLSPPPPTGDDPPPRDAAQQCEEALVMLHIGEILYAMGQREEGMGWTRDGVGGAVEGTRGLGVEEKGMVGEVGALERCRMCGEVGVENWTAMVRGVVEGLEREVEVESGEMEGKGGWLWSGSGAEDARAKKRRELERWRAEELVVLERVRRARRVLGGLGG